MTRRGRLRGVVAVLAGALLLTGLPAGAGTADDGDGNGAGGTITGTVTDDRGTPLGGVDASVSTVVDNVDPLTVDVVTDADGTFEAGGLPPGQYFIWFSDPQHRVLTDVRSGILVGSGGTTRLDVELIVPGVITGTVLGDDGRPLPTRPWIQAIGTGRHDAVEYDPSTGDYLLRVRPGPVRLSFEGDGLSREYYDDAGTLEEAEVLTAVAGRTIEGIDVVLSAGRTISGMITAPDGTPVVGVEVDARTSAGEHHFRATRTAADGSYEITGLLPATYTVSARSTDYAQFWLSTSYPAGVPLGSVPRVTGIDMVMELGGRIEGTVTGPDGQPARGLAETTEVLPTGYPSGTRGSGEFLPGGGGRYSVLVPAGQHVVRFGPYDYAAEYYDDASSIESATPVSVAPGQAVTGIDAVVSSGATLTGRVTDTTGAPASGVVVTVGPRKVRTGDDGRYSVDGLVPGTETWIYFDDPQQLRFVSQVVVVDVATTPTRDVVLQRGGVISGRVTDFTGEGLNASVQVSGPNQYSGLTAGSPAAGTYSIVVAPGTHTVRFSYPDYLPEYYDDAASFTDATPVTVLVGQKVTGIDAVLSRGGSVTGVVVDAVGNPIPAYTVRVGEVQADGVASASWWDTFTATDGTYRVDGLRPGTPYRVLAQDPGGRNLDVAVDVVAVEGTATVPALVAVPGGSVSGRITGPRGEPVANVMVAVTSGSTRFAASTRADGTYTVPKITPGTFRVDVSPPYGSPYASQVYDWQPNGWAPFGVGGTGKPVTVTGATAVSGIDMQLWYADLRNVFTDVPENHPFVREIAWLKANGITTGNANGTFGPTVSVTREATAAFLNRVDRFGVR